MESLDAITSYDGMGWDMIPSALWIYIYIYIHVYIFTRRGIMDRSRGGKERND